MVILGLALLGALLGLRRAVQARGNRLDRLQHAVAGAIAGAILGMFATILLERLI